MKYLIAGLGNPGPEYTYTRHNIGFRVCDALAGDVPFSLKRLGWLAEAKYKGRNLVLLKPNTYMNLSGKAVNYWLQELKIPQTNLMVVMDDIALPFGKLRMRGKGSSAGHNGLKDIESYLGTKYPRLRFGVGDDFFPGQQADYVLSNFAPDETVQLPELIGRAAEMCRSFATIGLERTMSLHNG